MMLTPEQLNALESAKTAVVIATLPHEVRHACNAFRSEVAALADQVGCEELIVMLTERAPCDLNAADCDTMIALLMSR
jgi:hypothetical protein